MVTKGTRDGYCLVIIIIIVGAQGGIRGGSGGLQVVQVAPRVREFDLLYQQALPLTRRTGHVHQASP